MQLTEEILTDLKRGEITFTEFVSQCGRDFRYLAEKVVREWGVRLPNAVDVDDLVQEMLLELTTSLPTHNMARGNIKPFVVFRVCTAARRAIIRAANSKGRDDLMMLEDDVQQAVQHVRAEERQHVDHMLAVLPQDERQRIILSSLAQTYSFRETAVALLKDPVTRHMFVPSANRLVKQVSVHTENRARLSVYRTAVKMAHRAQHQATA